MVGAGGGLVDAQRPLLQRQRLGGPAQVRQAWPTLLRAVATSGGGRGRGGLVDAQRQLLQGVGRPEL